jgi:hypothetical protein
MRHKLIYPPRDRRRDPRNLEGVWSGSSLGQRIQRYNKQVKPARRLPAKGETNGHASSD